MRNFGNGIRLMTKPGRLAVFIVFSMSLLLIPLIPDFSGASVTFKDCDTCHVLYPGMTGKEKNKKSVQDIQCVNCHTNTGGDVIKTMGDFRIPVVYNTKEPNGHLAGGNFYYVVNYGDRKGHNINGISHTDAQFGGLPPGYDRAMDQSAIGYNESKPLTCAGSNGCHGDRNVENPFSSLMGSHHAPDFPVDGSTTGKSYRYLRLTSAVKGISGYEDEDWGLGSSPTKHNEYSAGITKLCNGCHGEFHGADKKKVWFRHPVGVVLPERGEYRNYSTYSPEAPVGRSEVPKAPIKSVVAGSDVVVCLTCHMAHGSPYNSMLRWNYDVIASAGPGKGNKGGCFICHSIK